jgi:hypothetical protein
VEDIVKLGSAADAVEEEHAEEEQEQKEAKPIAV